MITDNECTFACNTCNFLERARFNDCWSALEKMTRIKMEKFNKMNIFLSVVFFYSFTEANIILVISKDVKINGNKKFLHVNKCPVFSKLIIGNFIKNNRIGGKIREDTNNSRITEGEN